MFVDGPTPVDQRGGYAAPCTTSNAWPVVDVLWTGNFLLNMAVFGAMSDEELQKKDLSRGSAIGVNLGLAALALSSAIVGFTRVSECKEQTDGPRGYSAPQRFNAPPRATQKQEEAEEEAAVQAQMRARSAKPAATDATAEDAPAVTPTPAPAPAPRRRNHRRRRDPARVARTIRAVVIAAGVSASRTGRPETRTDGPLGQRARPGPTVVGAREPADGY